MAYVTVGRGTGWSVARSKRVSPSKQGSGERVFATRPMPDGSVVRELDRAVHEQALKAANRKLRTLLNKP